MFCLINRRLSVLLAGSVVAGIAVSAADAAVLASWENNDLTGPEASAPADVVDAGLAAAPALTRGAGLGTPPYADTFSGSRAEESSLADAIADGDYFSWTMTADPGFELSLESLSLRPSTQAASLTMVLFSSVDGFAAGGEIDTYTFSGNNTQFTTDLSGLSNVSSVEFRLVAFGSDNQFQQMGIGRAFNGNADDDLVISGAAVPIPEPASLALVGVGTLAILGGRRRG